MLFRTLLVFIFKRKIVLKRCRRCRNIFKWNCSTCDSRATLMQHWYYLLLTQTQGTCWADGHILEALHNHLEINNVKSLPVHDHTYSCATNLLTLTPQRTSPNQSTKKNSQLVLPLITIFHLAKISALIGTRLTHCPQSFPYKLGNEAGVTRQSHTILHTHQKQTGWTASWHVMKWVKKSHPCGPLKTQNIFEW